MNSIFYKLSIPIITSRNDFHLQLQQYIINSNYIHHILLYGIMSVPVVSSTITINLRPKHKCVYGKSIRIRISTNDTEMHCQLSDGDSLVTTDWISAFSWVTNILDDYA